MPVLRDGGLNVTGEGGILTIADGRNAGSGRINITGPFARISLNNLQINLRRDEIGDALPISPRTRLIEVRNTLITGVHGEQALEHGDGLQVQDGADIDSLLIEATAIYTAYQALRCGALPGGGGVKVLILRRVNIRDIPELRKQKSIALYFGDQTKGPYTAPYKIVLEEVYVEWPDEDKMMCLPFNADVQGAPIFGVPPGGDFCPA